MAYGLDFPAFAERKTQLASHAIIPPLVTVEHRADSHHLQPIGNRWTRQLFDGDFYLLAPPLDLPAVSLIFVRSRDGNTVVPNPATLGGGPTDMHLIYEGLSRVAADAVLAGAATVGKRVFFSVWHPEILALRREFGLPRHPAQAVLSREGHVNLEDALLFNVPEVPVFLITHETSLPRLQQALAVRPWITVVPLVGDDLVDAFRRLRRDHGIERISVVGGRTAATALTAAGLTQDLCLTTTAFDGGRPQTPFYTGAHPPALDVIVRKQGTGESPITFEHFSMLNV